MGKCCAPLEYGMNAAAKEFDGENKYIRITDIDDDSQQYLTDDIVSPDGTLEGKYLVRENDILFARTGASVGKSYLYNKKDGKLYFAGFLIRAHVKSENNAAFIFYQTQLKRYQKWVAIMSTRSGQPGINAQEYESYSVYLPNIAEQRKITNFITLLDTRILAQNKILQHLESLIKGLNEKVLWQYKSKVALHEILKERNERTTINNQHPVISSTAKGLFLQSEYFDKEVASADNVGYKVLRKGNIVLSPQNLWLGNINYNDKYEIGIVSPSYKTFTISEEFNPFYVACLLRTYRALYEYACVSEQGASVVRRNLDMEAFMEISFPMPSIDEQNRIAEGLQTIYKKLQVEKALLDKYRVQKQYLLQQMFI